MGSDPNHPVPTLLLFADISGYTRYIRENPFTEAHALATIAALLDQVIDQLEPAFRLAKLEGDAAFCHVAPELLPEDLPALLLAAFAAFEERKAALIAANSCTCLACKALDKLALKMLLHQGDVVHFPTRRGMDLGGLPVILLHRLSKNRVKESRYILWTEQLAARLAALQPATSHDEDCEGIGTVPVRVYRAVPGPAAPVTASRLTRLLDSLNKARLWIVPTLQGKPGKAAAFAEPPAK